MAGFTDAMRKKALETRQRKAEERAKLAKVVKRAPEAPKPVAPVNGELRVDSSHYDWLNSPLPEAQEHLAELEREYKRASQIILQRTSRLPRVWKCWSQSNKEVVPKSVLSQCRGNVADGKWVSRDDGHKNERGELDPIVTCSMLCHEVYLKNKPIGGLGRR